MEPGTETVLTLVETESLSIALEESWIKKYKGMKIN
jgi:hypothetical protein